MTKLILTILVAAGLCACGSRPKPCDCVHAYIGNEIPDWFNSTDWRSLAEKGVYPKIVSGEPKHRFNVLICFDGKVKNN